jgi:four helix bundle protein
MEDRIKSFEDLEAWKCARELVCLVYAFFRREPASRDFGLRDQVQRAAVSAMTNLAEGFERMHLAEKLQFYNIARASCGEVRSLGYVMHDAGYLSVEEQRQLQALSIRSGKLISGLIHSTAARQALS